jgi:predicted PhzF superfamily epimerase YddE/YHI9
MKVPFQTVDVFTDRQFGGNPVAVISDARDSRVREGEREGAARRAGMAR